MTLKGACKCSVSIKETLLDLDRFQLTTFQGDDIFQYNMVIYSMFHVTWATFEFKRNQLGTVLAYVM